GRRRLGGFDVVVPEPPGGGSAPARTGAMTPDRPSNAGGRGASATLSNPTLTGVSRRLTSCRSTPTASSRPAGRRTVLVAVDDVRAERRDADRDVLGALRPWSGVAHPLARRRMYGLTCGDVEAAAFVLDGERAPEHQCVLVELGALPGLAP